MRLRQIGFCLQIEEKIIDFAPVALSELSHLQLLSRKAFPPYFSSMRPFLLANMVNLAIRLSVALSLAKTDLLKTPYAFSGGQRQRIGIARALIKEPELVLCDEPIAALDVSIQAHVVNLLKDLQEELKLSYLFTAHDLSMVRYISDRIGVMYLGTIVETGDTDKVFQSALHPYTKALLAAVPRLSKVAKKEDVLEGEAESIGTETGCLFAPRCPYRSAKCLEARPVLESAAEGHQVACFRWKEING